MDSFLIINGKKIDIGKIELDKNQLLIKSKDKKYLFYHTIFYSWKEIESISIGEKRNIDFDENCFYSDYIKKTALVWPESLYVERISDTRYCFYSCVKDKNNIDWLSSDIVDNINSLETKIFIDKNDICRNKIIYRF